MREIKFRGERIDNGEYIYGDLLTGRRGKRFIWGDNLEEVYPESVAQLCGHDCDGAEVYETDTLIDELENEYEATIYMRPDELRRLTLVKAA